MNMYPYSPSAQMYSMHPQQMQQAMFVQNQPTAANLLFHQYNQLYSMQAAYSNPALASMAYSTSPSELQQQQQQQQPQQPQQQYRPDQLVPQTPPQISTPVQQQIPTSSPINMIQMTSPHVWLSTNSMPSQEMFQPISHGISRSMLDLSTYTGHKNSISSNSGASPIMMTFETSRPVQKRHSRKQSRADNYQRRERQHSGSSCYESDAPDLSSDEANETEWRPSKSKLFKTLLSSMKKRSSSSSNDRTGNDWYHTSSSKNHSSLSRPKFAQYIEENIIGKDHVFTGPWGPRRMFYCDYTASGRSLEFIENFIRAEVLPVYGNTHSETSMCAQQSTRFREEARQRIKNSVNANEDDVLLFTGTGSTGTVHTLVTNFDLHDEKMRDKTVVIISAFEHHSNILPWQETGVEMVRIPTTNHGILDGAALKDKLEHYSQLKKRIICSLNAASNITGILTDVDTISTLVHSYSAYVFWDYATAAPYVKIDMNPSATAYKDAVFISTHKFIGGPGTPGILIAKKKLFSLRAPKACGGGTVNFVTRTCREYNYDIEIREEGGTPDIIGCVRAGLVFQLKDSLDQGYIEAREDELVKRFTRRFRKHETLFLLGSLTAPRLPIFSFIVYVPGISKYLHHNFVCLLLNDLFGIQVRSGCACAGPYALDLLNVNDAKTDIYCMFMTEDTCARGDENIVRTMMMKPGFTRLNLSYFAKDDEIEYILNAVEFIATDGWKFLPLYTYNPANASWTHRSGFQLAQSGLEDITYKFGKMQFFGKKNDYSSGRGEKNLPDPFREAKLIAAEAVRHAFANIDFMSDPPLSVPDKYKKMVWFALPIDIVLMMVNPTKGGREAVKDVNAMPFIPDEAKARVLSLLKTKADPHKRQSTTEQDKQRSNRLAVPIRIR